VLFLLLTLGFSGIFKILTGLYVPPNLLKRHSFSLRLGQHPENQIKQFQKLQTMVIRKSNRQTQLRLFDLLQENLKILLSLRAYIWMPTNRKLVKDDSHRVDIAQWVSFVVEFHEFLGGDVVESTLSFIGEFVSFVENGQPKVSELVNSLVDENILRFEVLMKNFLIKQHLIPLNHLIERLHDLLFRKSPLLLDFIQQRPIPAVLHHNVVIILGVALYGLHADQVGVRRQLLKNVELALDHFPAVAVQCHHLDDELVLFVVEVDSAVHHAEGTTADLLVEQDGVFLVGVVRSNEFCSLFLHEMLL
jgi:hypothetical protein